MTTDDRPTGRARHGDAVTIGLLGLLVIVSLTATAPMAAATVQSDEAEPNDERSAATEISTGTAISGEVAPSDDVDWFAFEVEEGETITVSVSAGASGTNNVKLHSEHRKAVGKDVSDGTITLGTTATYSGTYYLEVSKDFYADRGSAYTLEVETAESDAFEPNEDRGNATSIDIGTPQNGEITIGDTDWFAFSVDRGTVVDVSASATGDGTTDVKLFSETRKLADKDASEETAHLGATARQSGTHYLRLQTDFYAEQGTEYTVTVDASESDPFEPNEDRGNATSIEIGTPQDGEITIGDTDWFAFSVDRGTVVNVSASATGNGTTDVKLFSETRKLADKDASEGTAHLGATARQSGTHYLRLQSDFYAEQGTEYTITVDASESDPFEPNEDRGNATNIDGSPSQSGTISIGDHDWFEFTAQEGEPINVSITGDSDGKINVKLHSTEKKLADVDVSDGTNTLSAVANSTGTYHLHISRDFYADRGTDYSFEVETAGIAEQTNDDDDGVETDGGDTDADDGGDDGDDMPIVPAAVGLGAVGLLVAFVWRRRNDEES